MLWFECEMFPTGSCVPTLGPQWWALVWEAVELLGGGAFLEEIGQWSRSVE